MAKENSDIVVLKLRNGDELVAQKTGSTKTSLTLNRPLQLQRSTLLDPASGDVRKNICIFRDWLEFSTEIECTIPMDTVLLCSAANPDISKRYTQELHLLDNPQPKKPKKDSPKDDLTEAIYQSIKGQKAASLDDILAKLLNKPQASTPQSPTTEPPKQSDSMVSAHFQMPPDVFLNIVLNLPMFEMGQDMLDDMDDGDGEGFDDDSEEDPKTPKTPPNPKNKKNRKPESGDEPPEGWNGRFGFPK